MVGSESTTCLLNQQGTERVREKEEYNEHIRTGGGGVGEVGPVKGESE